MSKSKSKEPKSTKKNILQLLLLAVITFIIVALIRIFLLASYKIPSQSMQPTLQKGDYIIVNKLIPGTRIISNFFSMKDNEKPEIIRLKGLKNIQRNDVVVFNFPYLDDWTKLNLNLDHYYAKRCIGLPGDTLYIEDGIYKIKNISDTLGYFNNQLLLAKTSENELDSVIYNCYPFDGGYKWNAKHFGPLYIPKQGDILKIDTLNIHLYKNLISYETDKPICIDSLHINLGDSVIEQYRFEKNYYFMAGDFVFDSQDSRYWGLLPEGHIIGKAILIWKSNNPQTGKIRWGRLFSVIK